jgi:light-regulated signal transduction histidine kinase (bacteriophytochrome)
MTKLKRSNKELERFAYVSSHDLQEPLRMVALYSQLLERRYKDKLDDDANDFIEYIVDGARRMRQLIDDLLEYSRVSSKAKEFEEVNFEKVLDNVLSNLSILIIENNVIDHDPLPTIYADQNQMTQVFQNLIINAIKFHGPSPPEINISAHQNGDIWTFAVKDNGIGINTEHQKQIFEVFKRLQHEREKYPGSGIGLSITQKIITRHGGQIWVESEPGKGSTFYFTLPIQK